MFRCTITTHNKTHTLLENYMMTTIFFWQRKVCFSACTQFSQHTHEEYHLTISIENFANFLQMAFKFKSTNISSSKNRKEFSILQIVQLRIIFSTISYRISHHLCRKHCHYANGYATDIQWNIYILFIVKSFQSFGKIENAQLLWLV